MHKPARKNSHKERIFSLPQNKIDFGYQKEHQDRIPKEQQIPLNRVEAPLLLAPNKARESVKNLDGWQLTDDHKMIYRGFILRNFMTAIDLVVRIAAVAEDEKHHPDIHLTQYRNLRVGLTSHDLGGLSEKDILVARKINELYLLINKPNHAVPLNQQLKDKAVNAPAKTRRAASLISKKNGNKTKTIPTKKNRIKP